MIYQMIYSASFRNKELHKDEIERGAWTAECETNETQVAVSHLVKKLVERNKLKGKRFAVHDLEVSRKKLDGDFMLDGKMTEKVKEEFLKQARPGIEHFVPLAPPELEEEEEDDEFEPVMAAELHPKVPVSQS